LQCAGSHFHIRFNKHKSFSSHYFTTIINMKLLTIMAMLAIGAIAAPHELTKRQSTANDVNSGSCKKYTFIMARGSTEPGNMVRTQPQPQ
jgi:hypothetical protein